MSRSRGEALRELLARVHERLSRTAEIDESSRELLTTVMEDIRRALEREPQPGEGAASSRSDAASAEALPRLEALAVRFETEHPALGQVLRQLVDFLARAGI